MAVVLMEKKIISNSDFNSTVISFLYWGSYGSVLVYFAIIVGINIRNAYKLKIIKNFILKNDLTIKSFIKYYFKNKQYR